MGECQVPQAEPPGGIPDRLRRTSMRTFGACAMGRHTQRREVGGGGGGKRAGREGEGCVGRGGRGRSESGEEGGYLVARAAALLTKAGLGTCTARHMRQLAPRGGGWRGGRERAPCVCLHKWCTFVGMHVTNQTGYSRLYRDPKGRQ